MNLGVHTNYKAHLVLRQSLPMGQKSSHTPEVPITPPAVIRYGPLCCQCAPLLAGGSQPQHCSANISHLPAGCSPVHSMSPLALPGDKDQKGAIWFSFPHSQRAAQETCHPQISSVTGTPCMRCRRGSGWLREQARHSAVPPALAESRAGDNGGSPGQLAAGGGAQQGAVPAEMPGSLSLGPRAAARGRHQLGIR